MVVLYHSSFGCTRYSSI